MTARPREGRVTYQVSQFIPSEPRPGPLAHWADRLCTGDRDEAYALARQLGRCRVQEFEVVKVKGRLVTRERHGSPFRVEAQPDGEPGRSGAPEAGNDTGGPGVQSSGE